MQINGPAQAGGDAFGLQAGSGGGMTIGGTGTGGGGGDNGFAEAAYRRYLGSELQRAVQSDDTITKEVFSAQVSIWIDGAGRVTQARIRRSTGDHKLDDSLVAALQRMPPLGEQPPANLKFPLAVDIRGRRGA
jgi:TonB family protein